MRAAVEPLESGGDREPPVVADLVEASRVSGVRRIVVANMPFRVRGGSVAGDFRAALALSGGNPVEVRAIAWINYPDARADFLDGPPAEALGRAGDGSLARLRVPEAPFCGYVGREPAREAAPDRRTAMSSSGKGIA